MVPRTTTSYTSITQQCKESYYNVRHGRSMLLLVLQRARMTRRRSTRPSLSFFPGGSSLPSPKGMTPTATTLTTTTITTTTRTRPTGTTTTTKIEKSATASRQYSREYPKPVPRLKLPLSPAVAGGTSRTKEEAKNMPVDNGYISLTSLIYIRVRFGKGRCDGNQERKARAGPGQIVI